MLGLRQYLKNKKNLVWPEQTVSRRLAAVQKYTHVACTSILEDKQTGAICRTGTKIDPLPRNAGTREHFDILTQVPTKSQMERIACKNDTCAPKPAKLHS